MPPFVRTCTYLAVVAACALGATSVWPTWANDLGLDVWNVPAMARQMENDKSHMADMEEADQAILRRMQVKDVIIGEVIAGRTGLLEAAVQFKALHSDDTCFHQMLSLYFEGRNPDERLCNCVREFVRQRLREVNPSRGEEISAALEREFRDHTRDGELTLPESR
jgi:hypothetical protein